MPEEILVPPILRSSDHAFEPRANRVSDQFLKPPHTHFPVRREHTATFSDTAVATCLKPFAHFVILAVYAGPKLSRLFDRRAALI
jgi:hypothetical protein